MKIISWNVNGIRAAAKKGLLEWMSYESPDFLCLQEVKADPADLDESLIVPFGYKSIFEAAKKKGYSGVTTFFKTEPLNITRGIGLNDLDTEGRVLSLEYEKFVLVNSYFPNSQREHQRLGEKLRFCAAMARHLEHLRSLKKNIILCGDLNIAHKPIDLKNPESNKNNAGFLPEERAWLDEFVELGYVDVFRNFCKKPDQYTWWSYRPGIRERNIGWRLDYFFVNHEFMPQVAACEIHPDIQGSDHCPVSLHLK